jgi:hypothetical protein
VIPVFITALLNRPDLLDRLVDSIDVPIERALVVDNGHTGWTREGWAVVAPPFMGLGWPGALNFGITQTPDAPWWFFANNDAYFEPGKLAMMVDRMQSAEGPLVITDGYTVGALNRAVVDAVGLFDEWSFYPIYFDDSDYSYRCHLAGVPIEYDKWCLEGDIGETNNASMTTKSDPALAQVNNRTWQLNEAAYIAKWGGLPGHERYTRPWDRDLPVWATKPDPRGRMLRSWR